jgi:hypothetical protein
LVHEVIQVGERLAEGEAHLVPVDGCWRPATWGRCRVSIQKWDQRFESAFLQRRVREPSVPLEAAVIATPIARHLARPLLASRRRYPGPPSWPHLCTIR